VSSQSRVVPYVVEVDRLGAARAFGPAEPLRATDDRVIIRDLAGFVRDVRSVVADPLAQRDMVTRAFAFVDREAAAFLNIYFADPANDPRRLGRELTRLVEITGVLAVPGSAAPSQQSPTRTWKVSWTERTVPRAAGGLPSEAAWEGYFTIRVVPPTHVDERFTLNPLGSLRHAAPLDATRRTRGTERRRREHVGPGRACRADGGRSRVNQPGIGRDSMSTRPATRWTRAELVTTAALAHAVMASRGGAQQADTGRAVAATTNAAPAPAGDPGGSRLGRPRDRNPYATAKELERAAPAQPLAAARSALPTISGLVADAEQNYRATGIARVVTASGTTVYPFGRADAVLQCRVLTACIVELERGERLTAPPLAGDQARWLIVDVAAAAQDAVPLVVVKPKQCGIATNLIVVTNRRVYDVGLTAASCRRSPTDGAPSGPRGTPRIRFYYPDVVRAADAARVPAVAPLVEAPTASNGATRVGGAPAPALNQSYRVVRTRRRLFRREPVRFPWEPAAVWDDGAHAYIQLPPEARRHAAPVLYALEDDGSRALVNYTIAGGPERTVYVTDRVFRRAALVIATGKSEQRLVLENRAWSAPAPAQASGSPNGRSRP
jgi:type IV secretory pathway TrbF-like protein/type IV secretory pathway VirB9-like protein